MDRMRHCFFDDSEPMIRVEDFYEKQEKICDICVITFSIKAMEWLRRNYECRQVAEIGCANGARPVYAAVCKGRKIAFYMSLVGAGPAGSGIEELAYLTGATKFIMFGSAGSLRPKETEGKIIVPASAYREEGLSWHYLESEEEYVEMPGWKRTADFFADREVPYTVGRTWTTDAMLRETANKVKRLQEDGCIAVEMECAGVQAVCTYKGFELYDFLFASDHLGEEEWNNQMLGTAEEYDMQIKCMKLAIELAGHLSA